MKRNGDKKRKKKEVCIEIMFYPQSIYKNLNSTDTQYYKRMNIKKIYGLFFILKKRTRESKRNVFGQLIRFWKVGHADNFSAPFLVYSNTFKLFEPRLLRHK